MMVALQKFKSTTIARTIGVSLNTDKKNSISSTLTALGGLTYNE